MHDDVTLVSVDIAAYDLAEVDHRVEIVRDVVIRPVFEVQVDDVPLLVLLQLLLFSYGTSA